MLCYLACLRRLRSPNSISLEKAETPASVEIASEDRTGLQPWQSNESHRGRLICAGYSYGSVMARRAPTAKDLATSFSKASAGSTEKEIFLRADNLARLHHERSIGEKNNATKSSHLSTGTMAIGGQESQSSRQSMGREHSASRHGLDLDSIKRRIDIFRERHKSTGRPNRASESSGTDDLKFLEDAAQLQTSYLIVSPPLGFGISLITAFAPLSFESTVGSFRHLTPPTKDDTEDHLVQHQSFAVWGEKDSLQSSHHVRKWVRRLEARHDSMFHGKEIAGAGHFWQEGGVVIQLKEAISGWLSTLVD